jgi:hypothetical protein
VAEIHHLCLKSTAFVATNAGLSARCLCKIQKNKSLRNVIEMPKSGMTHALLLSVNLDLERTIPSGGGS